MQLLEAADPLLENSNQTKVACSTWYITISHRQQRKRRKLRKTTLLLVNTSLISLLTNLTNTIRKSKGKLIAIDSWKKRRKLNRFLTSIKARAFSHRMRSNSSHLSSKRTWIRSSRLFVSTISSPSTRKFHHRQTLNSATVYNWLYTK